MTFPVAICGSSEFVRSPFSAKQEVEWTLLGSIVDFQEQSLETIKFGYEDALEEVELAFGVNSSVGLDATRARQSALQHSQFMTLVEAFVSLMELVGPLSGKVGDASQWSQKATMLQASNSNIAAGPLSPHLDVAMSVLVEVFRNKAQQIRFITEIYKVYGDTLSKHEGDVGLKESRLDMVRGLGDFKQITLQQQSQQATLEQIVCVQRKRRRINLPSSAVDSLREWFSANESHPYPSDKQKEDMAALLGITIVQVQNWFINQRKRHWELKKSKRSKQQQLSQSLGYRALHAVPSVPMAGLGYNRGYF